MSYSLDVSKPVWGATFSGSLTDSDILELEKNIETLCNENIISRSGIIDLKGLSSINIDFTALN